MAWTLCTKEDITAFHPIPVSEIRDEWSDMVEGLIREHMGQTYLGTEQEVIDEVHNGDGSVILRPRHTPILSVEAVYINDSILTPTDYVVFQNYIQLRAQTFPQGNLNIRISYTAGSVVVPDPITRLAATTMVIAIINYRKRAGADSSIRWSSAEQKAGEESPSGAGLISHLRTIMKGVLRRPKLRVG